MKSLFTHLKGETLVCIEQFENRIVFHCKYGTIYDLAHCTESYEVVYLAAVYGNFEDLLNSPILMAEEVCSADKKHDYEIWTFYKLATINGTVTLRWVSEENAYYSTTVELTEVSKKEYQSTYKYSCKEILVDPEDENNSQVEPTTILSYKRYGNPIIFNNKVYTFDNS